MTPSATPLVTRDAIARLKKSGLHRLAVSLDGADAATHDGFRGVAGSFQRTMEVVRDARRAHLPVQINITIARHNVAQLDAIADLLSDLDIELWSVFFLVPTGRALAEQRLSADECEAVFEKLWRHTKRQRYTIKTTEAPHFRRFLLQRNTHLPTAGAIGTNDGRGVMFVSHIGEIYPSGFLPICCGRFPLDSLVRVYQSAELFVALRDGSRLRGKCGECEFRNICGGSRARAFGINGDPLAEEPDCTYQPGQQKAQRREVCKV
jgi:radical SAM protein with 4Fe4S-binding SPASM domain